MPSIQTSFKTKFSSYFSNNPLKLYLLIAICTFLVYTVIDYTNTYIFNFYPIYNSIYAQGSADSIYFLNAVNNLLTLKSLPSNNFDGGLLALAIYIVPVSFSTITHTNIGFSFRLFYLVMLLVTGYFINLIGSTLYSSQTGLKLSLIYIFNPLIFLLSVWAGSEEIIETVFFVVMIYFVVQKKYSLAIVVTLVACFYKYYSILFLPIIILSIDDKKRKMFITLVLTILFSISGIFILIFLNKYIQNVLNDFVLSFNLSGKGVFDLLAEYGHITQVNQLLGFIYYGFIGLCIITFYWFTHESRSQYRNGFVLLLFFIFYPEFYSSYLIIPYVSVVLYYPKVSTLLPKINYIILPILSFLSEFSFNHVDSPYTLLHIEPIWYLRAMGVLSLLALYLLIISWLILYIQIVRNEKKENLNKN